MAEFWLHVADYGVKYIIMAIIASCGVFVGISLRKERIKKSLENRKYNQVYVYNRIEITGHCSISSGFSFEDPRFEIH